MQCLHPYLDDSASPPDSAASLIDLISCLRRVATSASKVPTFSVSVHTCVYGGVCVLCAQVRRRAAYTFQLTFALRLEPAMKQLNSFIQTTYFLLDI
jgi:hypothetical protein